MREIYVKAASPREIAVVEDGKLVEYLLDDQDDGAAETIYLGRVERVVSGMQAAFVDVGQEKNGFLPLEERSKTAVLPKLQSGMPVLVQIKKEAAGSKGAFLTRDITLAGRHVILMPMNRYIGVSSRVEDESVRKALQQLGREITQGEYGLVMRASAADASDEAIRDEVEELRLRWQEIAMKAPTAHVPSMVHEPRSVLASVLDDYAPRGIDRIVTNDEALAASLKEKWPVRLTDENLMILCKAPSQLERALGRHVWLDSGAFLVIDHCEAMTVIDVNTGKFTGKKDLQRTILQTNLEACADIARQIRLRNVSGIIIIDMIDMDDPAHREQVLQALKDALSHDRVKTVVHGFTSLGLIEMTRKKSRVPLRDEWTAPCRQCRSTGRVPLLKEENHG